MLVVKKREQLENFDFQIKIKNFIGTCKKTIHGIQSNLYTCIYTQGNANRKVPLVLYFKEFLVQTKDLGENKTKQKYTQFNCNCIFYKGELVVNCQPRSRKVNLSEY